MSYQKEIIFLKYKNTQNAYLNPKEDGGGVAVAQWYVAVAQWYSQRTTVLEVAGSIPAPVIVELL